MIRQRLGSGLLSTGQLLSIVILALVSGLMVWAVLPLAFGWSTHAVVTGSMSPQVRAGDVLVSDRVDAGDLQPGMVALFRDPADRERILSHRIKSVEEDGWLITQGDANPTADAGKVPVEDVVGVAKLRIPWIGYPAVWLGENRYDLVAMTLAGLVGMSMLAMWPDRRDDDWEQAGPAVSEPWPWLVHMRTP